ncbi:hypothetical protein NP493_1450g01008 [Ridgeia piscesae]|uniref:EGF-like domain-containing protein n=1 Tax=Ridgeia piscesae TaxID=27915 RepID=A0AAD9K342_RIDPI|nr:hypothetical protein NP493_1450g01008 [Ridgeia piscesae]
MPPFTSSYTHMPPFTSSYTHMPPFTSSYTHMPPFTSSYTHSKEIDECSSRNPCDVTHSTCVNKDKFFECQCTEPWIPDVDGLGCSGK